MNRWILTTERLPELDTPVWLFKKYGEEIHIWIGTLTDPGEDAPLLWTNAYSSVWYNSGEWECDAELDDDYQPDYWMPLPEPPF